MNQGLRHLYLRRAFRNLGTGKALSPQQVTEKLLEIHATLGNSRYMAQVGLGGLRFAETARSIELLATEIMPAVNREIGTVPPAPDGGSARGRERNLEESAAGIPAARGPEVPA